MRPKGVFPIAAPGKILMTGEYAVLDGALAWAVPTRFGQRLFPSAEGENLYWTSFDQEGKPWFEAEWNAKGELISTTNTAVAGHLSKLLQRAVSLGSPVNPFAGWRVVVEMDFPREWGLGSSSSLIVCVAGWLQIPPLGLFEKVESGSGYDVAVSELQHGITYRIGAGEGEREISPVVWKPDFVKDLYFCYSGQKQSSRAEVGRYRTLPEKVRKELVKPISDLTQGILQSSELIDFKRLLNEHESLMGEVLKMNPLRKSYPAVKGSMKHLGAWGGDFFLLATDSPDDLTILRNAGIGTVFSWLDFIQ